MPLVSIIIPVFNSQRYLKRAINSALNQTWTEKEIIVVNDGSTDESLAAAKEFEQAGITIINQSNKGASAARNVGLDVAKGEWIQFLDADDFLRDNKIENQFLKLKNSNQVAVCNTKHFVDDNTDGISDDATFFQSFLNDVVRFLIKLYGGFDYKSGMIQPNAFLVSREVINKAGKWNESLSLDDDGEFFCRVILQSKEIVYVPEVMNYYQKYSTSQSLSGAKSLKAFSSQFLSNKLKHQHLLISNNNDELIPYIHTATFKAMQLLMHSLYPHHKTLFTEVNSFTKSLMYHPSRGEEVYGGAIANFIGNKISWRFLKKIQIMKSHF